MAISRPNIGQQLINKGNNMGEGDKLVSQGYNARKDEWIAMRVKKKRTAKQLANSRNESYGKSGSKMVKKGKINRRKA